VRVIRVAIAAVTVLTALGCFEEPVREHVHLTLLGGEVVVVTTVQDVASPDVAGSNQRLADRLDEARTEIERGWDRWRPLYDTLEPIADRSTVERVDGLARRAVYSGAVTEFRPVERFLDSVGMTATLAGEPRLLELQLSPSGSPPATWNERQEVERRIDDWSAVVAAYLGGAVTLYEYLDQRPDRAVACLSHVLDSHAAESGPLDEREEELVSALKERIEAVSEVLLVGSDDPYSLNELSRRAFDPFPARLTVSVAGEPVEVEGFVERDGYLERPAVDLWTALASLEGRWIAPDLVTAMIAPVPGALQPQPDPEAFAALDRRYAPAPDPSEVASALRSGLIAPDLHRVRWRPSVPNPDDLEIDDPRQLLDKAVAGMPP
jgi:hypothetical protein